ncbi:MAG TPA: glycoside hydrolase family 3 C-terminal domain-containing protein [Pyrinomonadaceae bacterium]|nr:glycoside hydrolase family 3 C-terminal domain-containing protein [Pyrinomonadaceae bacterium]
MRPVRRGVGRPLAVLLFTAALASAAFVSFTKAQERRPLYLDPGQPIEARIADLLSRMTLEEKVAIVHADNRFSTAGVPRLGIPPRQLSDGPHGVREETVGRDVSQAVGRTDDFATYMPALLGLAATWNTELARAYGTTLGEEARQRGKQIMLAPGMNIMRTPLNGRNFEYLGEDPYLASRMAVEYIRGEQAEGVASCAKHFAGNEQEFERNTINVEMDERTLREIYLPPFRAAVQEAGVLSVMSAYNKFRGTYCSENDYLLNKILKDEWGFKGLVVSDWNAVHSTRGSVLGGLDLEMGTVGKPFDEFYLARPFLEGVRGGEFPMSVPDDKVRRNLRVMFATHAFDGNPPGAINTKAHQETARRVAEESFVLLKNEANALPLDADKLTSLAVVGENAVRLQAYGGGSSRIKAFYEIPPLEGILRRVGERVNVTYSAGYGEKATTDAVERAVRAASQADAVIYVGGLNHARGLDSEGEDRKDLKLPYGQDELIRKIVEVNPRTIVVLLGGGPVEMGTWLARVPAVLYAWYPGMEGGSALARVLFGDVSPSGKLPCTFPVRLEDSPAHALSAYPGRSGMVRYEEGLLVGYRWFDTKQVAPLFPFGYGLSYTRFEYSNLKLVAGQSPKGPVLAVTFDLKNTGDAAGAEVAQVYVRDAQSSLPRPLKELKGFGKVFLKPGESQTVRVVLDRNAFSFYDPDKRAWVAERGDFRIMVGGSSRDIKLEGNFSLAQTVVEK